MKIKCPACKKDLAYNHLKNISEMMEIRSYGCIRCSRQFERHVFRDSLGLIKSDSIYELDINGNHIRVWK